jgi:thiamine-phosphate pyrophosphorylase
MPEAPIIPQRCRLVLVLEADQLTDLGDSAESVLAAALSGGDVASLILTPGTLAEEAFAPLAEPLVPLAQGMGVAVIIAGYTRTAGRLGADGLQLGQDRDAIADAVERFTPKMMVGAANVKTRHTALVIGERDPDYLMFGKPGGDTHDVADPKAVALGEWWSQMVELPCIVMGGTQVDSVVEVAMTGCDFVALGRAIFGHDDGPDVSHDDLTTHARDAVVKANALLDEHAPSFAEGA